MRDRTVLPLRYGTVLEGVDELLSMMIGRQEEWRERWIACADAWRWGCGQASGRRAAAAGGAGIEFGNRVRGRISAPTERGA